MPLLLNKALPLHRRQVMRRLQTTQTFQRNRLVMVKTARLVDSTAHLCRTPDVERRDYERIDDSAVQLSAPEFADRSSVVSSKTGNAGRQFRLHTTGQSAVSSGFYRSFEYADAEQRITYDKQ